MARYFSGEALYGDDFGPEQLAAWYAGEREGYAEEVLQQSEAYRYKYHLLNRVYGFRHLAGRSDLRVLGIGSADGEELAPLAGQSASFDILEPSELFSRPSLIDGVPATYHAPREDGLFDFADDSFDVVTAFSALHHIANVSTVIRECHRVLKPGGFFLCREPIVSMGDWRHPRLWLTANERGIPYRLFREILLGAGFAIRQAKLFDFSPFARIVSNFGWDCFGNRTLIAMDRALSTLFSFNRRYHRQRLIDTFGPASAFYVAAKR